MSLHNLQQWFTECIQKLPRKMTTQHKMTLIQVSSSKEAIVSKAVYLPQAITHNHLLH